LQAIISAEDLDMSLDDATWFCWSTIQGLVVLQPKIESINGLHGGADISTKELVGRFTNLIVAGLRGGLSQSTTSESATSG
jgi:hypothetical protein